MSFLLDTDTCSAHLRGDWRVFERMTRYGGRIHVSAVSVAELTSWLNRSRTPRRFNAVLNDLLAVAPTLSIDQNAPRPQGRSSPFWQIGE